MRRNGDILYDLLDSETGQWETYEKVTTLPDGTAINDTNILPLTPIYRKSGGEYFKKTSINTRRVSVKEFGAKGDGLTDDTAAILKAISYCGSISSNTSAGIKVTLWFPDSSIYKITDTLAVPAGVSVVMDGGCVYDGDNDRAAIIIGEAGTQNYNVSATIKIDNANQSDWSNDSCVGVRLINMYESSARIVQANGFTHGVECIGESTGFVYNTIYIDAIKRNKVGLLIASNSPGGNTGWANENLFIGGRFGVPSSVGSGLDRYGVVIKSLDGVYENNNNNVFIKPSFELQEAGASPGEALPILIENGSFNSFLGCRSEGNGTTFIRTLNASQCNKVEVGYGRQTYIDDQGVHPSTLLVSVPNGLVWGNYTKVYDSGNILSKVTPFDDTNSYAANELNIYAFSLADPVKRLNNFTLNYDDNYVEFPANRGLGVRIDTSYNKRFVVKRDTITGNEGRVRFICRDAAGAVLYDAADPYILSLSNTNLPGNTSFGNSYGSGSDGNNTIYFKVLDAVKQVDVFITGGTNPVRLRSMSIECVDNRKCDVIHLKTNVGPIATQAPSFGTFSKSTVIYSDEPESGVMGWVCVAAGSPGTWEEFGNIGDKAQIEITGTTVNLALGTNFWKEITANLTLALSNASDGKKASISIRNTDTNAHTVTITGVSFPSGSGNSIPAGGRAHIRLQQINGIIDSDIKIYT